MFRKLMLVLLSGAICLLAVTSVLAQVEVYNASEYEQLTGKKLEYQEAPMLRTMVAAGELPPLKERLPQDPLVVKPTDEIGQYGGTLRRLNELGASNYRMNFGLEWLAAYPLDMEEVYPNVLKGWKVSEDAKKFTLYLREGMRWSDGYPFTADDIMFWYEDVALNKDITLTPPARLVIGGEVGVMEKIDDYTIEISFSESYGVFIENFARWRPDPYLPKHYLKQFHPTYTPMSEIEEVMKKGGYDTWLDLFMSKMGNWLTWYALPERPVLGPWVAQNLPTEPLHIMVRNPYYWKVDTEGNQLPYIDKVTRLLVMDKEAMLLKTIAGEVDLQGTIYFGGIQNYSLIMQNREKGDYRVVETWWPQSALAAIYFNFSHEDPVLKEILNDKRFRIAMSVAMNRDEANQIFYKGLSTPSHVSVASGAPYFGERLGKNYLQYDPNLANQLLDEMGLSERDEEGYRLRPDGERLRMVNKVTLHYANFVEMAELYRGYWKEIGVETVVKPMEHSTLVGMWFTADYDLITAGGSFGGRPMNPLYRMGNQGLYGLIAPQWDAWFATEGELGEEPPQDVYRMIELREKALGAADDEERIALTVEIFGIHEDNLWTVGGLNESSREKFMVVTNRMGNVPDNMCYEWIYAVPAQFFIKE